MESFIRGIRYVGVMAGVLTFLLTTGPQEAFAKADPNVAEAAKEFDSAQKDAASKVPTNKTSKGFEDKLDAAAKKQDDAEEQLDRAKERQGAMAARRATCTSRSASIRTNCLRVTAPIWLARYPLVSQRRRWAATSNCRR